ncbi:MAG: RNA-guided endonuclease TnpB family protein, partial [Acidimicrobiales bacterium]
MVARAHDPLATTHAVVVAEDLNVTAVAAAGSGRERGKAGLNRAIVDAAPGELRRQLAYKATWYGSALVVAERWYPSSKT